MNTVTIKRIMSEEEFWSSIFGAGWETHSWWTGHEYLKGATWQSPGGPAGRVRLTIDRPDAEGQITKEIGLDELVTAFNRAVETKVDTCTGAPVDIENMDTCTSDTVLQIAVLGEDYYF